MTENITIWLTSAQTAMKTLFGFLNEEKTESSSDFRKNDTLSRRYKHTRPSKRRNSGTTPESNRAPPPFMVKYVSIHDVPEVFTKKPRDRSPFSGKTKVSTPCIVNYVSIPNHPDRPKDRVPSHELYKGITANHPSQQVFIKTSPKTSILLNKPANKKISEENLPPVSESFAVIKNPVYKSVARKRSRGIPYYASFVSLPKSSEENLQPVSESITVIKASVYESVTRKRSRGIPYYASFVSLPKLSEENIHPVGESIMVTEASVYGSVSRKRSRGIPYYASLVSLPKASEENLQPVSESLTAIKTSVYESVSRKRSRGFPYYASFTSLPKISVNADDLSKRKLDYASLEKISFWSSTSLPNEEISEKTIDKDLRQHLALSEPSLPNESMQKAVKNYDVKTEVIRQRTVDGNDTSTEPVEPRNEGWDSPPVLVNKISSSSTSLLDEEISAKTIGKDLRQHLALSEPSLPNESMQKAVKNYDVKTEVIRQRTVDVNDTSTEPVEPRNEGWDSPPVLVNKISSSSTSLLDEEISAKTIGKDLRQHLALSEPSLPNESMQKAVKNYDVKTEVIRQRTVDGNDTSTEPVEPRNEEWDGHPVLVNKICPSSTSLLDDILEKTIGKDLRSHLTLSEPSLPNESLQEAVKNYDVKGEVIRQRAVDGNDTSTEPVEPRNEEWDGHQVFVNKISSSRHKIITESDAKKIQRLIYRLHRDLSYFYFSDDSSTSSMVSAPDDTTAGVVAIPLGDTLKEGAGKVELDQNAKGKLTTDESPEKQQEFTASTELAKEPSLINVKLAEIPIVYHDVSKEREMKPVFSKLEEEGSKTSFSERMPSSAVGIESFQEPPLEAVQEFFEHILVDHAVKAERTSAAIERLLDKMEKEDVKTESNESMASRSSSEPSEESSLDVIDEFVKEDLIHPRIKEEHTDVATPRSLFEPKEAPLETEPHSNEINHEAVERLSQRQQEDSQQNKTYNYKLKHADIVSSSRSYTSKRKLVKSRRNTGSRHIEAYSYKPLLNLTFARFLLK